MNSLHDDIFSVTNSTFELVALKVFIYQYEHVEIYRQYCDSLNRGPSQVKSVFDIPFLPIEFFKNNIIISKEKNPEIVFESSGTTGQVSSRHFVADLKLYERSFMKCFELFYGDINEYVVLALLPSYLERGNSSLVYMATKLIERSNNESSGFFLSEHKSLYDLLSVLKRGKRKVILIGVTYALLDFTDKYEIDFPDLKVMETGGMKGRREDITREEVHLQLSKAFGVATIHSEYGMTELLSQAYSKGQGIFYSPPWMKILIRDMYDPLALQEKNVVGAVNVIDLANYYTCSFIATDDMGKVKADESFEIIGRVDQTEIRGCNLMIV